MSRKTAYNLLDVHKQIRNESVHIVHMLPRRVLYLVSDRCSIAFKEAPQALMVRQVADAARQAVEEVQNDRQLVPVLVVAPLRFSARMASQPAARNTASWMERS